MKNKVLIVGAFEFETMSTGGQPVKTRELLYALQKKYGKEHISYIDTSNWKKHPILLFISFWSKALKSLNIVMLPAHNGVKVFARLLLIAKYLTGAHVFYDVVGGWLPDLLVKDGSLSLCLQRFSGIWVETTTMMNKLKDISFDNVIVVRNFKDLCPTTISENTLSKQLPLKLCTFSRVMLEKGIEDAINAVTEINQNHNETIFCLDIYGQIDDGYKDRFLEIQKSLPEYIQYKGIALPNESVRVLKSYYALLFPTHFKTEGVPGTIIDAYYSGIPVIASRWDNFSDVIDEGITGLGYNLDDNTGLKRSLEELMNKGDIYEMKMACIKKSYEFSQKRNLDIIGLSLR